MADFSKYFPVLMAHEGGSKFTNIPGDAGGATKWGVTIQTFIANGYDNDHDGDVDVTDLKLSTEAQAMAIAKKLYWDKLSCDKINSQSIAEILFDFAYNSGVGTAAKHIQKLLGITADGVIGPKTIEVINSRRSAELFEQIKADRKEFYLAIIRNNPSQEKFKNGWLNRINSFVFKG